MPEAQVDRSFEAVVIGGGPAGSAAAYTLASRGIETCLVDKSDFPREKLCGGLLTEKCKRTFEQVFETTWDDTLVLPASDIAFHSGQRCLARLAAKDHGTVMYFTMRRAFDDYLLDLARMRGATLMLGRRIVALDLHRKRLVLHDGAAVTFKYLVGADGVNSQVARQLAGKSFDPKTIGFGLETEVPRTDLPGQGDSVEIDFSAARWGYGWIFPKRSSYTVGVGGLHRFNPDLRASLARYLESKGLDIRQCRVKGQYIPFGDVRARPGMDNVLLCGDAAGTVDPITGEGIAYAIATGHAAGGAVAICSARCDSNALAEYMEPYGRIARCIRQADRWRYLIFPAPVMRLFAWAFADASTLQVWFLRLMAGTNSYDALPRIFLSQAQRGLKKLVRKAVATLRFGSPANP